MNEVYRRDMNFNNIMGINNIDMEYYEERLFLERYAVNTIKSEIKELEDKIKECNNIRDFYDTLYFSYRRFNIISYHLNN